MRLFAVLFTVIVAVPPAHAQDTQASSSQPPASAPKDSAQTNLPVSLDKIKEALKQSPALSLRSLDETPTFRMQILEKQKIEELLATLFLKTTPGPFGGYVPGGGLYGFEQQRQMFPAVDNPLRQPYAAFSQGELLTILIENLVGKYLGGRALNAVSNAERARAEARAGAEHAPGIRPMQAQVPGAGPPHREAT